MKLFALALLCPFISLAQPKKATIQTRQYGTGTGNYIKLMDEEKASGTIIIAEKTISIGKVVYAIDSVSRVAIPPVRNYVFYIRQGGKSYTLTTSSSDDGGSWHYFFEGEDMSFGIR